VAKGVSFLGVDVLLAGFSSVSSFGVGHAEQVISSDSSRVTVVSGNRRVNSLSFLDGVNGKELVNGRFFALSYTSSFFSLCTFGESDLFLLGETIDIVHVASPELVNFCRVNGLYNYESVFKYFVRFRF
jgi:hypothetical protein